LLGAATDGGFTVDDSQLWTSKYADTLAPRALDLADLPATESQVARTVAYIAYSLGGLVVVSGAEASLGNWKNGDGKFDNDPNSKVFWPDYQLSATSLSTVKTPLPRTSVTRTEPRVCPSRGARHQ
jgi:hypothetical protein